VPVKRGISWLLTAPLLTIGLLAGHAAGYRWALSDPHQRAHILEDSGHAYSAYLPVIIVVALTLIAASLITRVRAVIRGEQRSVAPPPSLLVLVLPTAFLLQEYLERWLDTGHVHLATLWEPAVLVGLQLQIPFAVLALALASVLARAADAVGRALLAAEPKAALVALELVWPSSFESLAAARIAARGWTERGPPPSR
jgi:hypothetical protein